MLQALDLALESAQGIQKDRSVGQISLFDQLKSTSTKTSLIKVSLPEVPRWTEAENWAAEKELLGVYISGHPLASCSEQIKRYTTASATTLSDFPNNAKVSVAGMINEIRHKIAKNEERMAFVSLEDLEGSVELIFFPKIFSQSQDLLKEGSPIWVSGNVNLGRDENESAKLIVNEAMALSEVEAKLSNALHLKLPSDLINETNLIKIKNLVAENRGHCALFIHLQVQNCGEVIVKSDPSLGVSGSPKVLMQLEELLGEGKVWLSYEG
jgi:DNA polymerase-3 subunit alpha